MFSLIVFGFLAAASGCCCLLVCRVDNCTITLSGGRLLFIQLVLHGCLMIPVSPQSISTALCSSGWGLWERRSPLITMYDFHDFGLTVKKFLCYQKPINTLKSTQIIYFWKKIETLRLMFKTMKQILMKTTSNYSNYRYKYPCSSFFMPSTSWYANV